MGKTKTSGKQKTSFSRKQGKNKMRKIPKRVIREDANLKEYDPIKHLLDVNKMGAAIMECLIENDTEGALEIIESYLYALNKTQFLKKANIPRSTAYNFIKRRNPTIKTLAKIMHASTYP